MTHTGMETMEIKGSVMVVGGGIAGVQSALDLAQSGYFVHLVEKSPAIGGVMAQLDKTFPTNDCSMCILSPKLVEAGRHLNIRLITMAELESLEGEAGRFKAVVRERPRYVDMEKCIACGLCAEKCPRKKIDDDFNEGLGKRAAAYVQYPQAVPLKYVIDEGNCIYFEKGKCRACEKFCPAEAVDFEQKEKLHELEVGAVILAPGFKAFDARVYSAYGYGTLPNVVTSLEFERILSASGPYGGHLARPSDGQAPRKIAWLQCVGSRDTQHGAHGYCSGVCCMYAIKEAVIAKEHAREELDTAIFFMDMRTYGKDFERFYDRARHEKGVRFIRSRVHSVKPAGPDRHELFLEHVDAQGRLVEEDFDMVVLSVGLEVPESIQSVARRLGVALDGDGFVETGSFNPVETSRPGVFVCGTAGGPKDIPYAVMEASAASAASSSLLASVRNTMTRKKSYPRETDYSPEEAPRIGVLVCHCGVNIGSVVDVPAVRDYAKTLPHVAYVSDNMFTCSQDTQELMRETIRKNRLNRVVVAACSPRTHEPLCQETLREAGLNPYLFEFANIRDQDSWVHQGEPEKATQKAKDLVRMAVAKAALLEPIDRLQAPVIQKGLVVGGGVAGMNAALTLAEQGFETFLVEAGSELGGQARNIRRTWKGEDVGAYLEDLCRRVESHPRIEVFKGAGIQAVQGFVGSFSTTVRVNGSERVLEHGAVVLSTGARPLEPGEYLYGESDRVTRWHEMEELFAREPVRLEEAEAVAFIQCVGSREPQRPYCSKICCTASVQQALALKEEKPELDVYILYRDLRTFGQREELYKKARRAGVLFIRYDLDEKPLVEKTEENGRERLAVTVRDHVLDRPVRIVVDHLNLATAIVAEDRRSLAKRYKVTLNEDGFFLEAHMKLRPVDFATDGVFVCGLAHYPKPLEESVAQAQAAAARAAAVLAMPFVEVDPTVSVVDQEQCIGCGLCEASCPFSAIEIFKVRGVGYKAQNISASCKGCGVCAAACPQKAIDMKHFRDQQIVAAIHAGGER